MIKVIKRTTLADIARVLATKSPPVPPMTVTSTVKDWIAESRKNRIEKDNSSRKTIARWTADAQT